MSATESSATIAGARADARAAAWYGSGALCLAGAIVGTVSMLVPHPASANIAALWANIAAAFVAGLVAVAAARRGTPFWLTHPFLVGGTLLVANATYQSGEGTSYYAVWFVWIVLHAFSFYGHRAAAAHLAFVAVAYAGVLVALDAEVAVARWVTTIATLLVAAVYVDRLVRNLRRRAEVVEDLMGQLEAAAETDELTGLPNRRSWDRELARAVASGRRFGLPVAVAVLDFDGFKELNDTEGHAAGDSVLADAARGWSSVLREVDTLARWGGDEFGLLVTGCDAGEAAQTVERVRALTPAGISCSAGLVVWDGAEDEAGLMARADRALYAAKRAGRDRLVVGDGNPRPVGA